MTRSSGSDVPVGRFGTWTRRVAPIAAAVLLTATVSVALAGDDPEPDPQQHPAEVQLDPVAVLRQEFEDARANLKQVEMDPHHTSNDIREAAWAAYQAGLALCEVEVDPDQC